MKYRLKPNVESFQVVDGPFAGRKFVKGKVYEAWQISAGELGKFEEEGTKEVTSDERQVTSKKRKK